MIAELNSLNLFVFICMRVIAVQTDSLRQSAMQSVEEIFSVQPC